MLLSFLSDAGRVPKFKFAEIWDFVEGDGNPVCDPLESVWHMSNHLEGHGLKKIISMGLTRASSHVCMPRGSCEV